MPTFYTSRICALLHCDKPNPLQPLPFNRRRHAFFAHAHLARRLRLLAFHSSGNAEDMWTSEGTGARRAKSPLLVSRCCVSKWLR